MDPLLELFLLLFAVALTVMAAGAWRGSFAVLNAFEAQDWLGFPRATLPLAVFLWFVLGLSLIGALGAAYERRQAEPLVTALVSGMAVSFVLILTTMALARPRWVIPPRLRENGIPIVAWLRSFSGRPRLKSNYLGDEWHTYEAEILDAALQPWFKDAAPVIDAANAAATRDGRPGPYAEEPPNPWFDLPLEALSRHGFATEAQVRAALEMATGSPPDEWAEPSQVAAVRSRGWSRVDAIARIGLRKQAPAVVPEGRSAEGDPDSTPR
jgi:hypothetical protein